MTISRKRLKEIEAIRDEDIDYRAPRKMTHWRVKPA